MCHQEAERRRSQVQAWGHILHWLLKESQYVCFNLLSSKLLYIWIFGSCDLTSFTLCILFRIFCLLGHYINYSSKLLFDTYLWLEWDCTDSLFCPFVVYFQFWLFMRTNSIVPELPSSCLPLPLCSMYLDQCSVGWSAAHYLADYLQLSLFFWGDPSHRDWNCWQDKDLQDLQNRC